MIPFPSDLPEEAAFWAHVRSHIPNAPPRERLIDLLAESHPITRMLMRSGRGSFLISKFEHHTEMPFKGEQALFNLHLTFSFARAKPHELTWSWTSALTNDGALLRSTGNPHGAVRIITCGRPDLVQTNAYWIASLLADAFDHREGLLERGMEPDFSGLVAAGAQNWHSRMRAFRFAPNNRESEALLASVQGPSLRRFDRTRSLLTFTQSIDTGDEDPFTLTRELRVHRILIHHDTWAVESDGVLSLGLVSGTSQHS